MFSITELSSYCLAVFVLIVIPSPTMLYLTSRAIFQGRNAGLVSLLGVNFADLIYILLVVCGVSVTLISSPFLFTIVKIAGALYLLYLAFQTLTSKSNNKESTPKLQQENKFKLFSIGFLTNILNPKVMLFFAAIFSQFIKPEYGSIWKQSAILGAIYIVISFIVNSFLIVMATKLFITKEQNANKQKLQNIILACVLILIALKVLTTKF